MGCVINHMERRDANGAVEPTFAETVPIAAAQDMIAKTCGESNALCNQVPMLGEFHTEFNFTDAVKEHTYPHELEPSITGPMAWCAQLVWPGQFPQLSRQILS